MKRLYLQTFLAALLLTVSTNANAAVASMADLFGKYKFTATVEVTADGEAYKEHFAAESEVVITKDAANIYDAQITGFAGAKGNEAMKVNMFSAEKNAFAVSNPNGNNYGVFTGGIYYSEADGKYPFGETPLGALVFTYDPDTKNITVPDFTIIGDCDWAASTCKVLAKFTNVKMTLVEAENIEIADITGEWTVKGAGEFGTKPESALPDTYTLTLEQNGNAKTYTATFNIEGVAPFTLDATFDGNTLTIPFSNKCVDETNGWYVVNMYSNNPLEGTITFTYSSEKAMPSANPLVIGKQTGNEEAPTEFIQWWMNGSAVKKADTEAVKWDGTYTLKSNDFLDFGTGEAFPVESDFVVTYFEATDAYYVTSMLGYEIGSLNYGGLKLTPSADDPNSATIALDGGYGSAYLKSAEDNTVWYCIKDANGAKSPLTITRNEDGTFSLSSFFVAKGAYGEENTYICGYQSNVLTVKSAEEKPVWEGTYTVTATVEKIADGDYPETFELKIEENAYNNLPYVTSFITSDFYSLNYGGAAFTVSDSDEDKAEMASDKFVKTVTPGELYWKVMDVNGQTSPISFTRNADGTISIASFSLFSINFNNNETTCLAVYNNVVAKKGDTSVGAITNNADGKVAVYDIMGRQLGTDINSMKGKLVIVKTANGTRKVLVK